MLDIDRDDGSGYQIGIVSMFSLIAITSYPNFFYVFNAKPMSEIWKLELLYYAKLVKPTHYQLRSMQPILCNMVCLKRLSQP